MLNKVGIDRTECGIEIEESIVKELVLQGFSENITRKILGSYNIDAIIFDNIMREASILIDKEGEVA
jgi:hypothetical protein